MRLSFASLLMLVLITTPRQAPGPRDAAPVPAGTATITGRVVVAGGNDPAPLRRGRVVAEINGAVLSTDTDTNGTYRFTNAPAGLYRIRAEKPGFVMPEPWQRGLVAAPAPLAVREGQTATQSITMLRGAAFEGRIVNDRGEPAVNIVVSAVRLRYGPYGRVPVPVKSTRTDDRGRYRIHSLPAGDYYIEAAPDPLDLATQRPSPTGLAKAMYPGTAQVSEAQKMTAAIGGDVTGLDFRLTSQPLGTLNGTVRDAAGRAVNSMGLRVQRVGGPSGDVRASYLGETGQYFARGVAAGEYWLSVGILSAAQVPEFFAQKITIAATSNLQDVTTHAGVPVTGHVETVGGAPLPANLFVTALETEFELALPGPLAATFNRARVGADGTFSFPYLPNPRVFRIAGPDAGWAIVSVTLEAADIADTPVALAAGAPPGGLRMRLTNAVGTVTGAVTDARNQPVASARVVVFAEEEKRWTLYSRFVRTAESSAGGAFSVDGLLPGKYRAVAVDALDDNAWTDPEVLRALWGRATPVDVLAGTPTKIGLTLKERP